jgi:uncharacterized membrane protein YhdT
LDETYVFDYKEGILVVAYPNKDKTTDFEFEYWIAAYEEPGFFSFSGENGITNLIIFCVACVIVILLLIIGVWRIIKNMKRDRDIT